MEGYAHQNKCAIPESCTYWFCHHHKRCLLHEHVERNEVKEVKKSEPIFNYFSPFVKNKKKTVNKARVIKVIELPEQPTPITVENFFIRTKAVYDEIQTIPEGFHCFFRSKGSAYWTNQEKTHIVRESDHWGFNIRYCAWYLKQDPQGTYKMISSFKWKKLNGNSKRIGIVHISNFSVNETVTRQPRQKITSRWPE